MINIQKFDAIFLTSFHMELITKTTFVSKKKSYTSNK